MPLVQNKDVSMAIEELSPVLPKDDGITAVLPVPYALKDQSDDAVIITRKGYGKRIALRGFRNLRRGVKGSENHSKSM